MKFGAGGAQGCARRDRRAYASGRARWCSRKGTLIGAAEVAALEAAGIKDIVVARLEPGDVSEDVAAAEIAEGGGGGGRACRSRLHRARQSVCAERRRSRRRQGRHRPAQSRRRGDHLRDAAGLQAGGRRRDDRDREDHSLRGRQGKARDAALAGRGASRCCGSRPIACARSAWCRRCCRGLPTKVIEKTLKITAERLAPAGADDRRRTARAA